MVLCSIDIRVILFFCHVAIFMLFVPDIPSVIVYCIPFFTNFPFALLTFFF